MKNEQLTVFFDGACVLCSKEIEIYQKKDSAKKVRWIDISQPTFRAEDFGVDPVRIHVEMTAKRGEQIYEGVDSFIEIWKEVPGFSWAARLAQLSPIHLGLRMGYAVFVKIRPYLPRKSCDTGACDFRGKDKSA